MWFTLVFAFFIYHATVQRFVLFNFHVMMFILSNHLKWKNLIYQGILKVLLMFFLTCHATVQRFILCDFHVMLFVLSNHVKWKNLIYNKTWRCFKIEIKVSSKHAISIRVLPVSFNELEISMWLGPNIAQRMSNYSIKAHIALSHSFFVKWEFHIRLNVASEQLFLIVFLLWLCA